MLRRLHHEQPETFAFSPANLAWAEGQIKKYPEGRQHRRDPIVVARTRTRRLAIKARD
jgi:hypothetical protein